VEVAGVGVGVGVEVEVMVGVGVAVAGNVAVEVGVAVGVGVKVAVEVEVAVGVGVRVAVAVGVRVGVAVGGARRCTTPGDTRGNWNTVAMTTARGKTIIFRYSLNFAGTEIRKCISLAQSPLEDTATKGICQVQPCPVNLEFARHLLLPLPDVCAPIRSPQLHTSPACAGQRLSPRTRPQG